MVIIPLKIARVRKMRAGKIHTSEGKGKEKQHYPSRVGEEENMKENKEGKLISFMVSNDQYDMLKERANEVGIRTQDLIEFLIEPFTIALEEMTNDEKRNELNLKEHLLYLAEKHKETLMGEGRAVPDS
jgi:hypothetical protein